MTAGDDPGPGTRVFGLAGWSGSGKTTLVTALLTNLSGRGLAVSTIKHAHHDFDIDQPGKDSRRHRDSGATEVLIASERRWALMHELRGAPEQTLDGLVARMTPADLVLVEGFKRHHHPKLEVHRPSVGKPPLWPGDPTIIAVASDARLDDLGGRALLDLNDPAGIADFILEFVELTP